MYASIANRRKTADLYIANCGRNVEVSCQGTGAPFAFPCEDQSLWLLCLSQTHNAPNPDSSPGKCPYILATPIVALTRNDYHCLTHSTSTLTNSRPNHSTCSSILSLLNNVPNFNVLRLWKQLW